MGNALYASNSLGEVTLAKTIVIRFVTQQVGIYMRGNYIGSQACGQHNFDAL